MTDPSRLVVEAGARLAIAHRDLAAALRSIAASMPGYPSATGGGRGGGRTITVEGEQVPVTGTEAMAFDLHLDDAVRARLSLAGDLRACCLQAAEVARLSGLMPWRGVPGRPEMDADMRQALWWALEATRQLGDVRAPSSAQQPAAWLLAAATGVYGTVGKWSAQRRATRTDVERTVAPSEVWCSHCREHGALEPRRHGHGALCRWCEDYQRSAGHLPPGALVKLHHEGKRITVALIQRHDPHHAQRLKAS